MEPPGQGPGSDLGQFQKAVQSYDVLLKYYQDDVGWYGGGPVFFLSI